MLKKCSQFLETNFDHLQSNQGWAIPVFLTDTDTSIEASVSTIPIPILSIGGQSIGQ